MTTSLHSFIHADTGFKELVNTREESSSWHRGFCSFDFEVIAFVGRLGYSSLINSIY